MTLKEMANRIDGHLKRFEADRVINTKNRGGTTRFYGAGANQSGRYVSVRYVAYQGTASLSRDRALAYLSWLDAGNAGTHYAAERDTARVAIPATAPASADDTSPEAK